MENNNKAKILLENGSYINHINSILEKNDVLDFMIEEYFATSLQNKIEEYEPSAIGSNWVDNYSDFLSDGYTRDDIEYENYTELSKDLENYIIIDISQYYLEKYFDNDNDFLDDMIKYIKSNV